MNVFYNTLIALIAGCALSVAGLFIFISNNSGKPKPFLDDKKKIVPRSISEKSFVEINGKETGFIIKSQDSTNPVLLYLHGGMPDYFLTEKFPTGLDELFTVVWWDQPGAGLSYQSGSDNEKITIDNLISDTKAMTDYLKSRFSKDKIYLMGHSGGTYLGIKVIDRYPELYSAYIGVAQISYQKLSEKKAYDYIVAQYSSSADKRKLVEMLIKNPVTLQKPIPQYYLKTRDYAMHDLGIGTMHSMKNIISGIFIPSLLFKEYSLKEKLNLWRGKANSGISILWNEMINHDLSVENTRFSIPVYFFHGKYDYTCSYELAKEYYEKIETPQKSFFTFNNSAHSPVFEEPQECVRVIREKILGGYEGLWIECNLPVLPDHF